MGGKSSSENPWVKTPQLCRILFWLRIFRRKIREVVYKVVESFEIQLFLNVKMVLFQVDCLSACWGPQPAVFSSRMHSWLVLTCWHPPTQNLYTYGGCQGATTIWPSATALENWFIHLYKATACTVTHCLHFYMYIFSKTTQACFFISTIPNHKFIW